MKIELPIVKASGGNGYSVTILPDGMIYVKHLIVLHDGIDPVSNNARLYDNIDVFLEKVKIEHDSEAVIEKFMEAVNIWKSVFDNIKTTE